MATWTIAGVGAIGSLWAHKLHDAGHEVELILKDAARLEQYHNAGGIFLNRDDQPATKHFFNARLVADISQPIANLLVCTKSWQTEALLDQLEGLINSQSRVVLLQNGLGQLYSCQNRLQHCALYCASTTDGVFQTERFSVSIAGIGQTLIGAFNQAAQRETVSLPECEWQPNIETLLWRKLCINAVINPLTARYDLCNGDILTDARCALILAPLCNEISHIVNACGQPISSEELLQHVGEVATVTAANSSSMREDVRARRTTEIEEINGYLIVLAQAQGLIHAINSELLSAIKAK